MKNIKLLHSLIWIVLSLSIFWGLNSSFEYSYYFIEQTRMFEWTTEFAAKTLLQPLGLSVYLADFMTQFYAKPYAGAFWSTLLFMSISIGLRFLLKKQPVPLSYIGICLLPGIPLLFLGESFYYNLECSIAMAFTLGLCNIHIRIANDKIRMLSLLLGGWISYYVAGAAFVAFLFIGLVYELSAGSKSRWLSIISVLLSMLPVVVYYYMGQTGTAFRTFTPGCYANTNMSQPEIYYAWALMLLVSVAFLVRKPSTKKMNKYVVVGSLFIQIVVIGYFADYCYKNIFSQKNYLVMKADYLLRNQQWDALLAQNFPTNKNLLLAGFQNYALAQKGILADKAFFFHQPGSKGLILPYSNAVPVMSFYSDMYYALGNIALAQRYAFEVLAQSRDMGNPRSLVRLIQTNLIYGAYDVAEKYIDLLEHTLYYKETARSYRKFLHNEELINADKELGSKRKDVMYLQGHIDKQCSPKDILSILQSNPTNKVAFQYLSMLALFGKDLPSLKLLADTYKPQNSSDALPLHVQEGLLAYFNGDEEALAQYHISPSTLSQFKEFIALYSESSGNPVAFNTLKHKFRNTYWLYYLKTK